MNIKNIRPVKLYENVIEEIKKLIRKKKLKEGDKLPTEKELIKKLFVSQGTLREAFRTLESMGIMESIPGKGRFISKGRRNNFVDSDDIIFSLKKSSLLDLLEAREIIEAKILELAAQRATEDDIRIIEQVLNKMKKAIEVDTIRNTLFLDISISFHFAVAKATHNIVLYNMLKQPIELLREIEMKTLKKEGRIKEIQEEHQAMFQAIKSHDPKKAKKLLKKHLRNIREIIIRENEIQR